MNIKPVEEKPPEDSREEGPEKKRETRGEVGVQAKESACKLPQKFTASQPPNGL